MSLNRLSQIKSDRAALTLAIAAARSESAARRQQVDDFLLTREWLDVAQFCAGCAQSRSLHLPSWQPTPCAVENIDDDPDEKRGNRAAALLRQRMERAGVSRWHPDPLAACEAAERKASSP